MDDDHTDLRDALTDAVSDVDPPHRLDAIRGRTSRPRRRHRAAWLAAAGGTLVAASLVTALVVTQGKGTAPAPPVANDPTPTSPATSDPVTSDPNAHVAALYFLGDTPSGPRLFREFQQVPDSDDFSGELEALADGADDPDYSTAVRVGGSASLDGTTVRLSDDAVLEQELALQQVVYTLRAAAGRDVSLVVPGSDDPGLVAASPEALADVSISDPTEGRTVSGSFTARGVALSFEATVAWKITDADGTVVKEYSTMAKNGIKLSPWKTRIDVGDLDPGTYTFTASTDDPSGGEGPGPTSDTRTIVVQ